MVLPLTGAARFRPAVLVAAAAAALAAGCAISIPPPRSAPEGPADANAAWARVLTRFVDDSGPIDFAGIARDPSDLDAFVAYVAVVDPRSEPAAFPTRAGALAYYLNAYNALAMYDVIQSGIPPELSSIRVRFFYRSRMRMGGRWISLYALENRIIRPMGDPRVHFALNCMIRGCPRLPRRPFEGARLYAQLGGAARLFVSEERNVRRDAASRTVRLSEIFHFYTGDFLAKAPSLIAYVNLYDSDPIPPDWRVEFMPYDWTLNTR